MTTGTSPASCHGPRRRTVVGGRRPDDVPPKCVLDELLSRPQGSRMYSAPFRPARGARDQPRAPRAADSTAAPSGSSGPWCHGVTDEVLWNSDWFGFAVNHFNTKVHFNSSVSEQERRDRRNDFGWARPLNPDACSDADWLKWEGRWAPVYDHESWVTAVYTEYAREGVPRNSARRRSPSLGSSSPCRGSRSPCVGSRSRTPSFPCSVRGGLDARSRTRFGAGRPPRHYQGGAAWGGGNQPSADDSQIIYCKWCTQIPDIPSKNAWVVSRFLGIVPTHRARLDPR